MGGVCSRYVQPLFVNESAGGQGFATHEYYDAVAGQMSSSRRLGRMRLGSKEWNRVCVKRHSLMERCVEVVCKGLVRGYYIDGGSLGLLPADMAQFVLDMLVKKGWLNSYTVSQMVGCDVYDLNLNGCDMKEIDGRVLKDMLMHCVSLDRVMLDKAIGVDEAILGSLMECRGLKELYLDHTDAVTDAVMEVLMPSLPMLEVLSLNHCHNISGLAMRSVGMLRGLRKLSLESCLNVSRLEHVRELPLVELNVSCCHAVTNRDAKSISRISTLKVLHMGNTRVTGTGVMYLGALEGLTSLSLSGLGDVGDAAIAYCVQYMPKLEKLDVSRCFMVGDNVLVALAMGRADDSRLTSLQMMFTNISDAGLCRALPCICKRLEYFDVESCHVSDTGLVLLKNARHLRVAHLSDTRVGPSTMEALASIDTLERLDVSFTLALTEYGLKHIGRISSLKHLLLESQAPTHMSMTGLWHLTRLPSLESLNLFGSRVTDSICFILSKIRTLRVLDVGGGEYTSEGISALAQLPRLKQLSLAHGQNLNDGSIPHVLEMRQLVSLNLSECHISNRMLEMLCQLSHLKVLCVADMPVRRHVVEKLLKSNHKLQIKGLK